MRRTGPWEPSPRGVPSPGRAPCPGREGQPLSWIQLLWISLGGRMRSGGNGRACPLTNRAQTDQQHQALLRRHTGYVLTAPCRNGRLACTPSVYTAPPSPITPSMLLM